MHREQPGAHGRWQSEEGFTLLELMMVILIIGILIAVLTPTFLGASSRAKDRAVQTNLSTALTAAKNAYLQNQSGDYSTVTNAALTQDAGALTFVGSSTNPTSTTTISVLQAPGGVASQVILSAYSKSGNCFYVLDDETAATLYAQLPAAGGCQAVGAPAQGAAAWKQGSW